MMETRHAFQLIHAEMLEEQRQVCPRVVVVGVDVFSVQNRGVSSGVGVRIMRKPKTFCRMRGCIEVNWLG